MHASRRRRVLCRGQRLAVVGLVIDFKHVGGLQVSVWSSIWTGGGLRRSELELLQVAQNSLFCSLVVDQKLPCASKLLLLDVANVFGVHCLRDYYLCILAAKSHGAFETQWAVIFLTLSMH